MDDWTHKRTEILYCLMFSHICTKLNLGTTRRLIPANVRKWRLTISPYMSAGGHS
jgi:hypothetical protein